jgi:hypothetical protein
VPALPEVPATPLADPPLPLLPPVPLGVVVSDGPQPQRIAALKTR